MINGGNTRGPLAGLLGQLARPSDKEKDDKPNPLEFFGGLLGGAISELSNHAGNIAGHLANQSPFFQNGGWNGGISFPGRPNDLSVVLSGWSGRFCLFIFGLLACLLACLLVCLFVCLFVCLLVNWLRLLHWKWWRHECTAVCSSLRNVILTTEA